MRFLEYISIKSKLLFVFIIWMSIFVGFGTFAIIEMDKLGNVTKSFYDESMKVSNAATEAKVDFYNVSRISKDVLLVGDRVERESKISEIESLSANVANNLTAIINQSKDKNIITLTNEIKELQHELINNREKMFRLVAEGKQKEATEISLNLNAGLISKIEENIKKIINEETIRADSLIQRARDIEGSQRKTLVLSMAIMSIASLFLFFLIIRSILGPIKSFQYAMNGSSATGELSELELRGNNEIVEMFTHYNVLVKRLKEIFWAKDGQNMLSQQLSGNVSVQELAQRAINFLSRTIEAGNGVFYIYDKENKYLKLHASYAFTDRNQLSNRYALGQGIIGQVGLEGKPILLKSATKGDGVIATGIVNEPPLNIYAFPLLYEGELLGVIELSSFEQFNPYKQSFLNEVAGIIAINLYTAFQNTRAKELLSISEAAKKEAIRNANEIQRTNGILEEQQRLLQQQAEELQQTNAELEEQQQLLQQQSEELQQTNSQLEEQQQLMEEQAILLDARNKELERSKSDLMKRSEELELANKYKSEFVANISHELRTPLNSVILLSQILSRNESRDLNSDALKKIDVIHSSGKELLRLIDDVLDLSKIEAGRSELNITRFESAELVHRIRQYFEALADEKNVRFVIEDRIKAKISGDMDKISQILRNFLSNAFKFTKKGSIFLTMDYDQEEHSKVVFSVIDTGIGIAKAQQSVIFDEFTQGDGSVSRKYGGTGLGLSISKKLADLMGGEIKVSSELGEGSSFSLYISSDSKEYVNGTQSIAFQECAAVGRIAGREDSEQEVQSTGRVLIISDNDELSAKASAMSKAAGLDAFTLEYGINGMKLPEDQRYEGVVLNLEHPGLKVSTVLKEIKSTPALENTPVHIVSGPYGTDRLEDIIHLKGIEKFFADISSRCENTVKRILVVEKDVQQWQRISELMIEKDIAVGFAQTEYGAKRELSQGIYNAAIIELELQEGCGLEVCKFIRDTNLHIPVIIYTHSELSIEQEREIRKYTDSIIIKTEGADERLFEEVSLFLNRSRKDKSTTFPLTSSVEACSLSLQNKTIMVVDDDLRNIFVLAAALEKYGAEIVEAENGRVALEKLESHPVDLILMDIMMPEMDGYETIQAICSDKRYKKIPIIALTAKTLKEDREKCIAVGASDYISKPVDYDVLIRLIKAWI